MRFRNINVIYSIFKLLLSPPLFRSPIFLVSKGDLEGAKKSLQFFRGKSRDVTEELDQIKAEFAESQKIGSVGFFEVILLFCFRSYGTLESASYNCMMLQIWKKKEYLKPMCISLVLMALQQLSGINYVLSYSQEIFKVTFAKFPLIN